jgi:hypothetical protein
LTPASAAFVTLHVSVRTEAGAPSQESSDRPSGIETFRLSVTSARFWFVTTRS